MPPPDPGARDLADPASLLEEWLAQCHWRLGPDGRVTCPHCGIVWAFEQPRPPAHTVACLWQRTRDALHPRPYVGPPLGAPRKDSSHVLAH